MEKRVLRELYTKYGENVIFNPRKLRAYLLDMCVPKKSVNLLVDISKTDYFKRFAEEIKTQPEAREKLMYAIDDEYAFEKRAANFGADCWVYALTERGAAQSGAAGEGETGGEAEPNEADIWPEDKAELVAAALREILRS